jgi:ABC-2 type transport system permease protein
MDFIKFTQIAFKDIRLLFKDRATLVIIIVSPLVLTFVIGVALSGVSGNGSPIQHIPVLVVNHDSGTSIGPVKLNFGNNLTSALQQTGDLLTITPLTDDNEAESQVKQGKAAVAILIPANFSDTLNSLNTTFGEQKISVALFRDAGSPVSADIASAVVHQILNGFANASIAVSAGAKVDSDPAFLLTQANGIAQEVASNSGRASAPITVNIADSAPNAPTGSTNLLQYFAPAMAVFFLNFAMAFGAVTIIEEKENGTLQRLLASPTSRVTILAGKLGGTYVNGLIQITALIIGTSIIAPILGNSGSVWGTNILGLILLTLVVVAASVGFGTLLASLARTRQQAQIYTSAVMIVMGLVGGAFTPGVGSGATATLSHLTINYWATNAYFTLAQNGDLASVLPNIGVLLCIFVGCFSIGAYLFNRRLDV